MKAIFCLSLAVIFLSCNQKEMITSEEAAAAIRQFDLDWKNKNADGVDSIVAAHYIYFTQSGGVFDRASLVKTAGAKEYQLNSVTREQVSIVIEGNTAVVNTTWKGKGTYYGKPFDDYQRCSVTLIKVGGKTLILSEHCTPIK